MPGRKKSISPYIISALLVLSTAFFALLIFSQDIFGVPRLTVTNSSRNSSSTLYYSTYIGGGNDDFVDAIEVVGDYLYVAGNTRSRDFPITEEAFNTSLSGGIFVSKIHVETGELVYSTFIGEGRDWVDIAVDNSGSVYLTGGASADFPVTEGAYSTSYSGGTSDAFVTKLSADGKNVIFSTFLGGPEADRGYGIALDGSSNVYVVGSTGSGFPTSSGSADETFNGKSDLFIAKLNQNGSEVIYSTYLGGSEYEQGRKNIAVDIDGYAYITGSTESRNFPTTEGAFDTNFAGEESDAFITKLDVDGSSYVYSSYLGGTGFLNEEGFGVAVNEVGEAIVTGETASFGFPTTIGAYDVDQNGGSDVFVSKINSEGSELIFSTFIGGDSNDYVRDITLSLAGEIIVTGFAGRDFPVTEGSYFGGPFDIFIATISPNGDNLLFSTFLGGRSDDFGHGIAVDQSQRIYFAGYSYSSDFPVTSSAIQMSSAGSAEGIISILNSETALPPPPIPTVTPTPEIDFSITGQIENRAGSPIQGVTVSLGFFGQAETSMDGRYAIENLLSGSYTVTPVLSGYAFSPPTQTVIIDGASISNIDFTATSLTAAVEFADHLVFLEEDGEETSIVGKSRAFVPVKVQLRGDGRPIRNAGVTLRDTKETDLGVTNTSGNAEGYLELLAPNFDSELEVVASLEGKAVSVASFIPYTTTLVSGNNIRLTQEEADAYTERTIQDFLLSDVTIAPDNNIGLIFDRARTLILVIARIYFYRQTYLPQANDELSFSLYEYTLSNSLVAYRLHEKVERNDVAIYSETDWTDQRSDVDKYLPVQVNRSGIEVVLASPVVLTLVNPEGQSAGFDLISNSLFYEFPAAISEIGDEPYIAFVPDPLLGDHILNVIGTATGSYSMSVQTLDEEGNGKSVYQTSGITRRNNSDEYIISFDANHIFVTDNRNKVRVLLPLVSRD